MLIAHQDCAFYTELLHVPREQLEARQRDDIHTAARRIQSVSRGLEVSTFFARKMPDGKIRFEPWPMR